MTATELQNIVRVLANSSYCRYWLVYDKAPDGQAIMAIQCRDEYGKRLEIKDAKGRGFGELDPYFYTIPRTNEDGTPYFSKLE